METDACITDTISADTEARTNEGRPSKIVFKDYYADSVRHCLLGFRINLCSMLSE